MYFNVFSADPGTKNFACAMLRCRFDKGKKRLQFKPLGTCMLPTTLTDIKDGAIEQLADFADGLHSIADPYEPSVVCMERFQSRGLGGTTIEAVNMMLGVTAREFSDKTVRFITAATWKNRVNQYTDLKSTYKDYELQRVITPKTAHELDASLIGVYMAYQHVGLEDFAGFAKEGRFERYMEMFLESPDLLA